MSSEQPTTACICHEYRDRPFRTVNDALIGKETELILAGSDRIAFSEEKWMGLYRCRTCGTLWAEGCYDRGQVYFYYLFAAPPTNDPVRWLHEEAEELPTS